jgi:hypothetical protein
MVTLSHGVLNFLGVSVTQWFFFSVIIGEIRGKMIL